MLNQFHLVRKFFLTLHSKRIHLKMADCFLIKMADIISMAHEMAHVMLREIPDFI